MPAPVVLDRPLDAQPTLLGWDPPAVGQLDGDRRRAIGAGAWIAEYPGWLCGDQQLLDQLVTTTAWHRNRRPMYDRVVDVPRLTASIPRDGVGHPVLWETARLLEKTYGQKMSNIALALYRDGRDSVAPHGDQVARDAEASVMAILSIGDRRQFVLRPASGGPSVTLGLGHGDLLVLGGTIQRTWRHGVPKTAKAVGARCSVMFRPSWMR